MFLSMKTVSLQLCPNIGGLLLNKTDSYNMYYRVVFFEIESVLELSQCLVAKDIKSGLNRRDMHFTEENAKTKCLLQP